MNGNRHEKPLHFNALTESPIKPDRLREMLAHDERHLAVLDESIEKQERFIEDLDNSRRGDSTTIEIARALLATMKRARAGYIADRERIARLLYEGRSASVTR